MAYCSKASSSNSAVSTSGGPVFTRFVTYSSRLDTFKEWTYHNIQSPESLAAAGFFSTGYGDRVVCFYCCRTLWKWEVGDDPWIEHALYSPKCAYLVLHKNSRGEVMSDMDESELDSSMESHSLEEDYKKSLSEISSLKAKLLCKVCITKFASHVFLPCSHLATCLSCTTSVYKCPICRADIEKILKVYM